MLPADHSSHVIRDPRRRHLRPSTLLDKAPRGHVTVSTVLVRGNADQGPVCNVTITHVSVERIAPRQTCCHDSRVTVTLSGATASWFVDE